MPKVFLVFPLLVREQTSVLRHRESPYDVEFTQTHIPVKTSIQTGFETASSDHRIERRDGKTRHHRKDRKH